MDKRERFSYIFSVIGLIMLLGTSIYLGFSGWYFAIASNKSSRPEINSPLLIEIEKTEAETLAISFSGAILNGEKIYQNINIKNNGEKDMYIRAKAYTHTYKDGDLPTEIGVGINWIQEGEYYYYKEPLQSGATIGLASYIKTDEDYKFDYSVQYITNIVIEGLENGVDVASVWNAGVFT